MLAAPSKSITELDKKLDGLDEAEPLVEYNQINGIEVPLTAETPAQVGGRFRCRVEFSATGAQKACVAF